MLQQDWDDYVMAINETHSVKDFVKESFSLLDLDWENMLIMINAIALTEVDLLIGDPSKAKRQLNWEPKARF